MTVPRLAAVLLAAAAAGGCWGGDDLEPLPAPPTVVTVPSSTTVPVDYSGVALDPVAGTTTTTAVVLGPGGASLAGRVDGPEGPVAGATVLVERLVGDGAARLEVVTGGDGTWRAAGVLGGRYRVRAWRQPDLAVTEARLLFVGATETAEVVLRADLLGGAAVDLAVAPDPPQVDARTNVLVRLTERTVDAGGVVRPVPRSGVVVTLAAASGWRAESALSAPTDASGSATFTLVCLAPGTHGLLATVGTGEVVPLSPPECQEPPPPVPGTTAPPGPDG